MTVFHSKADNDTPGVPFAWPGTVHTTVLHVSLYHKYFPIS